AFATLELFKAPHSQKAKSHTTWGFEKITLPQRWSAVSRFPADHRKGMDKILFAAHFRRFTRATQMHISGMACCSEQVKPVGFVQGVDPLQERFETVVLP